MSTFFEIAGIILLAIAIPTIIVGLSLLFTQFWLDICTAKDMKRFEEERKREVDEDVTQKVAKTLKKVVDDADRRSLWLTMSVGNPRLIVAFDIIDNSGNALIESASNTIIVELAEDEYHLSSNDYYAVLKELASAVDRMASKGLATHLFYQRPIPAPSETPILPNRKGLVRNFSYSTHNSKIHADVL